MTRLGPTRPRTARPRRGSRAGFQGARVKVSALRMTASLPVGVVMARSYTPEIRLPGSCGTWMAFNWRDSVSARCAVSRCRRLRIMSGFGATSPKAEMAANPCPASQRPRSASACRSSAGKPGVSSCSFAPYLDQRCDDYPRLSRVSPRPEAAKCAAARAIDAFERRYIGISPPESLTNHPSSQ